MRQHAVAALLFVVLSVAMTWPLARNLDRAVADPGDPFIVIWILDWDWWATFRDPLSLFHANAFHPAKYSLAFSENLYGIAVLLFPLRAVGIGPITAYNIAMIAGFAFCGFAAYLLGRRLTGSFAAGLAAGIFYAFVPFRFIHLTHLQHVWGGWLPLLLFALLAYAERPTRRRAALFAAIFVMNGLTNVHYLFFGALATAVTAALLLPRKAWWNIGAATAVALLILAPFLYPYYAVAKLYGMQRTWEEVHRFSAVARDWLPGAEEPERRLFPGFLAFVAAAAALVTARRHAAALALALLWIAIGFLGSLGLNFELHTFLWGAVPGFRAIRSPARWAVIAYIGLAIAIALVTAAIARRNRWVALLVPMAFAIELWVAPIRWYITRPDPAPVDRWLGAQDIRAVANLPMDGLGTEYAYLLGATAHHKPMINGISGFSPPLRDELSALSNQTPIPEAFVDSLRRVGVDTIVIHGDLLGGRSAPVREWLARELDRGRLRFVARFDSPVEGDWVFSLAPGERRRTPRLEAFLAGEPTCGTSPTGLIDHPMPAMVFATGEAVFSGWTIAPHGLRSLDLWFDNRTVRYTPSLFPAAHLDERCTDQPQATRRRFLAVFPKRPPNIRRDTDVLAEVTDERGNKTYFEHRWFTWE